MTPSSPSHVMITGAGSGLGLGLALRYLQRGHVVTGLDRQFSDAALARLSAAGQDRWCACPVDVTDETALATVFARRVDEAGAPSLVLHCAGILVNALTVATSSNDFRRVVDVNLVGSFHLARAALPHLQRGSRLILVASMAGLTSNYGYAAYGASKFGVIGLAHTLRYELAGTGIGLTVVCPPEVQTPMVAAERQPGAADPVALKMKLFAGTLTLEAALDAIVAGVDAGRWMVIPGQRARLVAWLARHFPSAFLAVSEWLVIHTRRASSRDAAIR